MKLLFQRALILTALASASANAADLAILRNGNSIRHERREIVGALTRLYLSDSASGYIDIPTELIERFETDPGSSLKPGNFDRSLLGRPSGRSGEQGFDSAAVVDRQSLEEMVSGAGQRHQIDPDFINSVIRAESGFNNRAVSKKGALGLMQLMPETASQLGISNPFDADSNIEGGTKYLRELLEKYNFDVPKALAAYNAGPKRVDQYRGVPPYRETQSYVARIIREFNRQKLAENPSLARKTRTGVSHSQTAKTQLGPTHNPRTAATNSPPLPTGSSSR
jgi:Transglycosylase SLT domain